MLAADQRTISLVRVVPRFLSSVKTDKMATLYSVHYTFFVRLKYEMQTYKLFQLEFRFKQELISTRSSASRSAILIGKNTFSRALIKSQHKDSKMDTKRGALETTAKNALTHCVVLINPVPMRPESHARNCLTS